MIQSKIKDFKNILKEHIEHKSIKISGNGEIEIICRFQPFQLLSKDEVKVNDIIKSIKDTLFILLNIKYKVSILQKKPELSYNKYTELLSGMSNRENLTAKKYKRYLKYFKKENDKLIKSYSEIIIKFVPYKQMNKTDFILAVNAMMENE